MLAGVLDRATKGDADAVDDLLSQPEISDDAEPYWLALKRLERSRPMVGGMVTFPRPIEPDQIENEGRRLGFEHDDLDEFIEIVMEVDDHAVELIMKRLAKESEQRARKTRRPGHA